jgi:putative oxidoreductase
MLKTSKMKNKIFSTTNDWTGLVTRLSVGLVLFPHGAQQMLGIFGGYGFTGTMSFLTDSLHLPALIAFLVITIQFFGSVSLVTGFASRLWSVAVAVVFIGTIFTAHIGNGFFMNWYGTQKGEGFEYALLVIGLSIATLVNGSGKYSIDNILFKGQK